jgi:HEAT repeat protein
MYEGEQMVNTLERAKQDSGGAAPPEKLVHPDGAKHKTHPPPRARANAAMKSALLDDLKKSPDDDTRLAAVLALGEIADPGTIPDLIKALYDPLVEVRHLAADALEKIGTPEALAAVRAWKADHNGGLVRRRGTH